MSTPGGDVAAAGVAVKFVSAGLAGCVAETVTIPVDTAKVRLQVDSLVPTHNAHTLLSN